MPLVQIQKGVKDCGLFAMAFGTHGNNPGLLPSCQLDQSCLRSTLLNCLEQKSISDFPFTVVVQQTMA